MYNKLTNRVRALKSTSGLLVPDTDSHVICSTDTDSRVTCSKNTAFYKLHAAARLPHIRVS